MRIIISPVSETDDAWAIDFYRSWPFIAFEKMPATYCKVHGEQQPCEECLWCSGYDSRVREEGVWDD